MLLFSQRLASENLGVLEQLLGPFWDLGILSITSDKGNVFRGLIFHEDQAGTERQQAHTVSSINLYGASNYNIFSNHLRIRLSPIKSPILLKYKNPYKRNSMYPNISKCNAKSSN